MGRRWLWRFAVMALVVATTSVVLVVVRRSSLPRGLHGVELTYVGTPAEREGRYGVWRARIGSDGRFHSSRLHISAGGVTSILLLPNGGTLAYVTGSDQALILYGQQSRRIRLPQTPAGYWLISGYVASDDVAILTSDYEVLRVSLRLGTIARFRTTYVGGSSLGARGELLAGDDGNTVTLIAARNGRVRDRFALENSWCPALSDDGRRLAVFQGSGGDIAIYDILGRRLRLARTVRRPQVGTLRRLCWSPDGRYLCCEVARVVSRWLGGDNRDSVLYLIDASDGSAVRVPAAVDPACWSFSSMP